MVLGEAQAVLEGKKKCALISDPVFSSLQKPILGSQPHCQLLFSPLESLSLSSSTFSVASEGEPYLSCLSAGPPGKLVLL
jgi:hypothetical protein